MVGLQIAKRRKGGTFAELIRIMHDDRARKAGRVKPIENEKNIDITCEIRKDMHLYISDIEKWTKRKMIEKQVSLVTDYVNSNTIVRTGKSLERSLKSEYQRKRAALREQWEEETGQKWPTYDKNIYDKKGHMIRTKGQFYDAHHIVELSYSGVNKWWNIFPARHPDEHQQGIHNVDSIASKIFLEEGQLKKLEKQRENNSEKQRRHELASN